MGLSKIRKFRGSIYKCRDAGRYNRCVSAWAYDSIEEKDKKVRGIVAGAVLRRLSCRAVMGQFIDPIMEATAPFQFALQTRAGTDALLHMLQVITDDDEDAVVTSQDGIGAFDHVRRKAFLSKLHQTRSLQVLIPLVRILYGTQSVLFWTDSEGIVHEILQGEGGE